MKTGLIDTLSIDELNKVSQLIDLFQEYWVPRGIYLPGQGFVRDPNTPVDFYTLGAVTYIDGYNLPEYYRYAEQVNPVLKEYFGWLYDIVLDKLSEELNDPCDLIDELGHPGFHIFGHKPNKPIFPATKYIMENPHATIHVDLQHQNHMPIWNKFRDVDLENVLTFTLAIELPINGGGLNTWQSVKTEQFQYDNEYTKRLKSFDYGEYGEPTVVQYHEGKNFYFIGELLHQMGPGYDLNALDRRITLQGHGVKCDGIWRIYF
jgi:hypothetical protein